MKLASNTAEEKPPLKKIKHIFLNRNQLSWMMLDLEHLIGADHPARAIWEMVGRVDVSKFEEKVATWDGEAGRPCWPARVMISLLVYGYSLGVSSSRALERMQEYEPGMRWLMANEIVNHHTISSFRVRHEAALESLFVQILGVLSQEGLVDLQAVMQDGTKVEAVAGSESYRRRATLEKHLEQAREALQQMQSKTEEEKERQDTKREAAQKRAVREQAARMEEAMAQLVRLEEASSPAERAELRVSETEAEARKMKHADGSWALSYNVQVSTDASHKVIVGVGVATQANDTQQLQPAMVLVKSNCGELPEKVVADNGYATRDNVEKMSEAGVEFISPWKDGASREAGACKTNGIDLEFAPSKFVPHPEHGEGEALQCKAGKILVQIGERKHHGLPRTIFEAKAEDCAACEWQTACCGKNGGARRVERVKESEVMKKYLARMEDGEVKELYQTRKEVAEFPNLWIKSILGIRRFRVRGPTKAGMEATWVAISYNIAQWIRLRWEVNLRAASAA